jgi:putative ABC transport system permease protein
MTPVAMPPRLATRLLRRVLPPDVRDSVDGDLCELYVSRSAEQGKVRASLWYWGQALSFSARFGVERLAGLLRVVLGRDGVPSAIDVKLGGRMLLKHPGLALVGGFGMAVATAIGAGAFAFFNTYYLPDLPLDEGDRIVNVVNWDTRRRDEEQRVLHDFVAWRNEAKSLVDVGAFRIGRRNVIDQPGQSGPASVVVAEMSAAGFRVARVAPLLGRALVSDDERVDAPPVVVIGYDAWTTRFKSDTGILGRTIRLGRTVHTVVGVMPEGFEFPINQQYWIPLRDDPNAYPVGGGPKMAVFARLAPGATKASAESELTVIGRRMAAAYPKTHEHLIPRVKPYVNVFAKTGGATWAFMLVQAMLAMLLVVVCLNVAILVYARTVTRTGEIAVRTALGATRTRIVTQLFAEALVLSLISALAGLGMVAVGLRYLDDMLATQLGGAPFWVRPGLSASTVLYALGLAVMGAVIVGVAPALRATGAQLRSTLSALSGGSKPQLGRTWTALIVTQVAVTVAVLPPAIVMGQHWITQAITQPGFPAEEFLGAQFRIEREGNSFTDADLETPEFRNAMRAAQTAVVAALETDPSVVGTTFAMEIPGGDFPESIEIDRPGVSHAPRIARVNVNYFNVFGVKTIAGRTFTSADVVSPTARPVLVNRAFVERLWPGAEVLGRRIRITRGSDTTQRVWRAIVGVVDNFPAEDIGKVDPGDSNATLYEPIAMGELQDMTLFVHVRGRGDGFAKRLRAIAAAADPTLQLRRVESLDASYAAKRREWKMTALALVLAIGSVLLLSAAGMYALMSFTVSQRRREIGVRAALGADARRILGSVLRRAAMQLAIGVAAGLTLVVVVDRVAGGQFTTTSGLVVIPATAIFMSIVGIIAAAGPARQGLRIQPTEALRSE